MKFFQFELINVCNLCHVSWFSSTKFVYVSILRLINHWIQLSAMTWISVPLKWIQIHIVCQSVTSNRNWMTKATDPQVYNCLSFMSAEHIDDAAMLFQWSIISFLSYSVLLIQKCALSIYHFHHHWFKIPYKFCVSLARFGVDFYEFFFFRSFISLCLFQYVKGVVEMLLIHSSDSLHAPKVYVNTNNRICSNAQLYTSLAKCFDAHTVSMCFAHLFSIFNSYLYEDTDTHSHTCTHTRTWDPLLNRMTYLTTSYLKEFTLSIHLPIQLNLMGST